MSRFLISTNNMNDDTFIGSFANNIIEKSSKECVQIKVEKDAAFLFTYLNDEPLKGQRYFNNDSWSVLFLGEMIDYQTVPFQKIISIVEARKFEEFKDFNGIFAIIVHNKKEDKYYIIGDLRGQYPIYYHLSNEKFIAASELATFARIFDRAEFNEKWLYDFMYFNFPLAGETFLKNTNRLPYSSVLEYCGKTKKLII